jgi:hypothetical protein
MKTIKSLTMLVACMFALSMVGCSPIVISGKADVEKTAFGKKKKFAVVSIAAMKTFYGEKGFTQMFKDTDEIPGANSQPLIDAVKPDIIKKMSADKNIKLLAEKKVLSSKAYKAIKEDERKFKVLFSSEEMNVAKGYKYISSQEKMAGLAKSLNVDGVIAINMTFSVQSGKSGVSMMGISLGSKSYSPLATVSAIAYDRDGKEIWKDYTTKMAEPGDTKAIFIMDFSDVTSTNFETMHPKAIEIGSKAIDVLLARLDDTLSGKGTSSIQSMK